MNQPSSSPGLSSDLTFITNEAGKTLRDRFTVLLKDGTRFFDCLVGYFYISGFYKLYPVLENVEKIRVLVGLQTDRTTHELLEQNVQQGELSFKSHAEAKEKVSDEVLHELEKAEDNNNTELGIHKFTEWIRSGKLEIKVDPSEHLHAKVYIMTFGEGDRDKGRVITGSSNFTQSGLLDNLEFNVELKNRSDYEFALTKFNELWASAVDVTKSYEDTIANKSPYAHFTPYELYLKFLYEYFRGELNRPSELEDMYVPSNFKKLKYQEEAVLTARKILEEYGGVFLADVVGLGKTYMAALLAQQLHGRCLVIAPPHLLDKDKRGSWRNVFSDFQVRQTDFESIGNLAALLKRDVSKYENVFIDESHRVRTETTQTYEMLAQICRGKRVILVSATPMNNSPRDILSQVKLFQNGKNSTIPNLRNLEGFFSRLERNLKGLDRQKDRDLYFRAVESNAKETREKVLKYLMIRRTRKEIENHYGTDMKKQGLKFPDIEDPKPLFYKFNKLESSTFDETVRLLITQFKYARYKPLIYYEGKRDHKEREVQGQRNLAKFMQILIVKRLESSISAFRLTLERFIRSYERVLKEFRKGNVYISKEHINKIFELLEQDDMEAIDRLIEEDKAEKLNAKEFRGEFYQDLTSDLKILRHIHELWDKIKRDPKWEALKGILKGGTDIPVCDELKSNRIIVFTESKETAEYLTEKIAKSVDPKVIMFHGQAGEATHREVMSNFDANAFELRDNYRILVSTEALSEGVNLHRSNIVINYDIPWNPTRLIQRVGRVNRVDTKFDKIHTYNFFPTEEGNDLLKLREAAEAKIQAFIEMLGADARLLTEGEEIKSHDLFMKLNSRKTITGEDENEESELEYLTEIREVRDKQSDLFARIKHLPKKARSTRSNTDISVCAPPALLTYFRQDTLDKFFIVGASGPTATELDFFSTAKMLKPTDTNEKRLAMPNNFYELLDKNKKAFAVATSVTNDEEMSARSGGKNDAYILKRLRAKEIRAYQGFTEDDESYIQQAIQLLIDGALPRPTTKKVAEALKDEIEPLRVLGILRKDISELFFQQTRSRAGFNYLSPREVILSSYLIEEQ
ncbi:MAG: phospholipase D-like domain-containing protein [Bacteroidetes bacterium]|nr:phospholipase D-like domain-containing protein [Bacteroidota bacterium]MCL5737866.1 phospholipase D-like domain-containing protein [Bacteroidota bacterium]